MNDDQFKESRVTVELGTEAEPVLIRFCTGQRPGGRPGAFGTRDSYALHTATGWILVDPVQPTPDAAVQLQRLIQAPPAATVLTSDGHERFCYAFRQQWGTPVWGPVPGHAQRPVEYEGKPDHLYAEADPLPGGLRPIKLAGMWCGDHALLWTAPTGERILFSGDILNGQVEPDLSHEQHYRRQPGLYFGARPDYPQRHADPPALKSSLQRLLSEDFDMIAGSHSRPFRDNPKPTLTHLIETI